MKKVFLFSVLMALSNASFAAMSETCKSYLADVDVLVEQASKSSEEAKQKMDAMKPQLDAAKKQLAALPEDQQDVGCKQGIAALGQMKTALGIK